MAKGHLQDLASLRLVGEANLAGARQAPQNRLVNVFRAVAGAHDDNFGIAPRGKSVPERHKLRFDHRRRLVVCRAALPEERVELVNEDDGGLQLLGQGEDGLNLRRPGGGSRDECRSCSGFERGATRDSNPKKKKMKKKGASDAPASGFRRTTCP
jgi:hypothetical protein